MTRVCGEGYGFCRLGLNCDFLLKVSEGHSRGSERGNSKEDGELWAQWSNEWPKKCSCCGGSAVRSEAMEIHGYVLQDPF